MKCKLGNTTEKKLDNTITNLRKISAKIEQPNCSYQSVATKVSTPKCSIQSGSYNSVKIPKGSNAKKTNGQWNQMTKNSPSKLLQNDDVRRWYDNSRRSSILNAGVRLRRLNLFCERVNVTPASLVEKGRADPTDVENILLDHVSWMEKQGYAPGYSAGMIKAIKSWLEYNHVEIKRKIKVKDADVPVSIQDEQIPERGQLADILGSADSKSRAAISLMAFAGIRPQVMGMADRSDGLRISDLPDLEIDGRNVRFARTPAIVVVRRQLSKTRNKYFTFLTEEGCRHVVGYIRHRIAGGEILESDSPLIAVDTGYKAKGRRKNGNAFLTTTAISSGIRKAIRRVVKVRPYVLRAYFDSQLLLAESHGCMTHAYRQFFMGHKGDMEARYTTNKGRLTDQMTEDMRRAFEQSQMFLTTDSDASTENREEMLMDMWRRQASMYGMNPDTVFRKNESTVPAVDDHKSGITNKSDVGVKDLTKSQTSEGSNTKPYESKIVSDEETLLECTARGWEILREISDGKWLMRYRLDTTKIPGTGKTA